MIHCAPLPWKLTWQTWRDTKWPHILDANGKDVRLLDPDNAKAIVIFSRAFEAAQRFPSFVHLDEIVAQVERDETTTACTLPT